MLAMGGQRSNRRPWELVVAVARPARIKRSACQWLEPIAPAQKSSRAAKQTTIARASTKTHPADCVAKKSKIISPNLVAALEKEKSIVAAGRGYCRIGILGFKQTVL